MTEFNELQELWLSGSTERLPDPQEIIKKAEKEQRAIVKKMITAIICLMGSVVAITYVAFAVDFTQTTTYIGIGLMLLTIMVYSGLLAYQTYKVNKVRMIDTPDLILPILEQRFRFSQLLATKGTTFYFIVLNIAFVFYFIEVMAPMTLVYKIISLIVYTAWMLFAYFVVGKRQRTREFARFQRMLDAVKHMEELYKK